MALTVGSNTDINGKEVHRVASLHTRSHTVVREHGTEVKIMMIEGNGFDNAGSRSCM